MVQIISEHNEPNTRATIKRVYDGMKITSQNRWPSLRYDFGAINNILSPIFSAGFYYKTFMGPKGFWKNLYEPLIRRSAGLGKPPKNFRSKSTHQYHNTDVVIIGAGLSGLAAAKKFMREWSLKAKTVGLRSKETLAQLITFYLQYFQQVFIIKHSWDRKVFGKIFMNH